MTCKCWYAFAEEARATVGSVFGKCVACCIPLALLITLYFPIRAMTIDPKSTDYIVFICIVGSCLLCSLGIAIAVCCTKPKPPQPPNELPTGRVVIPQRVPSAKAPKLPAIHEEEDFEAPNPLRTTRHGPVWPPRS